MAVDIGQAIEEGGRRTLARNGLLLVVVFWIVGVVNGLLTNTIMQDVFRDVPMDVPGWPPAVGPTVGISPAVAGVLALVVGLVSLLVTAAAVRTFVTAETETIPGEYFTRNVVLMVLNLVVGGIVFGIVVFVGFVFLFFPGLFLLVSLFFWNLVVIVEDRNFVDGFKASWEMTKGNRIMLFVLGVVVVIVSAVVGAIFGLVSAFVPAVVGLAITQIGNAVASVFSVATAARTYEQLKADETAV